jgi:HK97 family phage portal protein
VARLLDRLLGRDEASRAIDFLTDQTAWVISQSYGTSDREPLLPTYLAYAQQGYAGDAMVFGCILERIKLFSQARFTWRDRRDGRTFTTVDLGPLQEPWPGGSTAELLARMEQDVSLAGNAFVRRAGDRLERLRPDLVTIISKLTPDGTVDEVTGLPRKVREVIGYAYSPAMFDKDRQTELYDVSEVAHWSPIPDPVSGFRGMSWITPVVREVDTDVGLSKYLLKHLDNNATPNFALQYKRKLQSLDVDEIRSRFKAKFSGPDNAGEVVILDDGADIKAIGSTMTDLGYNELQAAGALRIAFAAGVPTELLPGMATQRTPQDTVYAEAIKHFANSTMVHNWQSACAALSNIVDVPAGADLWYDLRGIAALQPGEIDKATTMTAQMANVSTGIASGFDPDAVIRAVAAGDLTLLVGAHSGLVSVQMQDIHGAPSTTPQDGGSD